MYKIRRVQKDFILLDYVVRNWPTSSNIFLIIDKDGLTLIDTGINEKECYLGLRAAISELGFRIGDIHTILLTHGHTDHIAGTNILLTECNPRILMSEKSIPEACDPLLQEHYCLPKTTRELVPALKEYDILANFEATCGAWVLKDVAITPVKDGEEIKAGNYTLRALQVPGHDIGLMVFYEPTIKTILTTDFLNSSGPGSALPWYTATAGGVESYLLSLNSLKGLEVETTLPSHGSINKPFTQALGETKAIIVEREARILSLLKEGKKSCAQLDALLFRPVVLKLCPWYSTVTHSHLQKLESEGKVEREGFDFYLTG